MRVALGVLAGLCVAAYLGGVEQRREDRTVSVPASRVDPAVCQHDSGIRLVTERPALVTGVYAVTCGDGVVLTTGNR